MAFQLQDDYLDTFGSKDFGKKIGGDISENKKTFLVIKTLELASDKDKKALSELLSDKEVNVDKISEVIGYFRKYKVDDIIKEEIKEYTQKAFDEIDKLSISDENKRILKQFSDDLMHRKL